MRVLICAVLSVIFLAYLQADNGCTEDSGRWCETDQSCAAESLCFICELLGGGGNDNNPSDPFPSDQYCFGACTSDSFSDGLELDNPSFPACPRYYCIRRDSGTSACVRRNELLGAGGDVLNLPTIEPFQNITQCLASFLTSPSWCNRFGVYAMQQTTENLAQRYAQLKAS